MTLARLRGSAMIRFVLLALGLVAAFGGSAVDAQSRVRILAAAPAPTYDCPARQSTATGRDFSSRALEFLSFAHQDLTNANFRGAKLKGVVFVGANLAGADFTNATFLDSGRPPLVNDFSFATLDSTCFIHATFAGSTYFTYATLTCADFSNVDLTAGQAIFGDTPARFDASRPCRTAFRGARMDCDLVAQWGKFDLTNADVSKCAAFGLSGLANADFTDARMDGVSFFQADLQGVKFDHADLHGANLDYANLKGSSFVGAQIGVAPGSNGTVLSGSFAGAFMLDTDFTDADLRSVNLSNAHLYRSSTDVGVSFVRARLDSTNLTGAVLPGAVFTGSLTNATFNNAMLVNANFSGADTTGAKFDTAYLQGADFSQVRSIDNISLNNAAVSVAAGAWSFNEQDGTPSTYGYKATRLGALATDYGAYCPNGMSSPCTGQQLVPSKGGPYPPVPACIPLKKYHYDNCPLPSPSDPASASATGRRP